MINETFFNDLQLLPVYFLILLAAFATLLVAIFFHELGHWIYFKLKVKKDIKIKFQYTNFWKFGWKAGTLEDYQSLTDRQYHDVNMFGVLAGYIPIIALGLTFHLLLLMVVPYTFGCWGDIKRMMESAEKLPPIE